MSNGLDPGQNRGFIGPDLGPNCLIRLSGDERKFAASKEEFTDFEPSKLSDTLMVVLKIF